MELLFVLVPLLLVALLLIFSVQRKRRTFSERDSIFMQKIWHEILSKAHTDPRHTILEADKLLDFALTKKGYTGSLGEKLKSHGSTLFTYLDEVWSVHKLRNRAPQ